MIKRMDVSDGVIWYIYFRFSIMRTEFQIINSIQIKWTTMEYNL